MATELRLRRGTTDEHGNFIGAEAEATVDTDKNTIVVHDGQTQGGFPLIKEESLGTAPNEVPTNDDIDSRGFAEAVDSVADLRASSFPANLDRLWLSGYYGAGTLGGGPLYKDPSDTTTADNGGTVFVDSDGVRWKRNLDNNIITADTFGGNGTDAKNYLKDNSGLSYLSGPNEIIYGGASNTLIRNAEPGSASRLHLEPNGYVNGVTSKFDWMLDPFDQINQSNYRIINIFTIDGGGNGQNGETVINAKGTGDHFGVYPSINIGFSDNDSNGVPLKLLYFDTSDSTWRTPMLGAWRSEESVNAGDYCLSDTKLYQAATTGTTGSTKPTHSSGTVSDGSVDWTFVRDYAAASSAIKPTLMIGDRDDMPKFGNPDARAQFSKNAIFWPGAEIGFLDNTDSVAIRLIGANSGATYIRSASNNQLEFSDDFYRSDGFAKLMRPTTEDSGNTTVEAGNNEILYFDNSSAVSVDTINGLPYQKIYVHAANSNTTLVHGTNIRLAGGVNRTVTADDTLAFVFNSSGTVAKQVVG